VGGEAPIVRVLVETNRKRPDGPFFTLHEVISRPKTKLSQRQPIKCVNFQNLFGNDAEHLVGDPCTLCHFKRRHQTFLLFSLLLAGLHVRVAHRNEGTINVTSPMCIPTSLQKSAHFFLTVAWHQPIEHFPLYHRVALLFGFTSVVPTSRAEPIISLVTFTSVISHLRLSPGSLSR
jgi:hypothetical protein